MKILTYFSMTLLFVCTLTLPARADVDWSVEADIDAQVTPLDMAASVMGNRVFVLTRGEVRLYDQNGKLEATIPVDPAFNRLDVSGLELAGIDNKIFLSSDTTNRVQLIGFAVVTPIDVTGSPFTGPEDAPVTIAVFSDFQCPYCARVSQLLDPVMEKNPDAVRIVYKHYPLPNHKMARSAALASYAAYKQGKFWEYHDELFANMRSLSPEKFEEIATTLGLDPEQFKKDMSSTAAMQQIQRDMMAAKKVGVRGTPSIYINGRKLKKRSPEAIQEIIDEELKKAENRQK